MSTAAPPAPSQPAVTVPAEADDDEPAFQEHDEDDGEPAPRKIGRSSEFDDDAGGPRARRRDVSQRTRELFKAASARVKAQLDDGEGADALEPAVGFEGEADDGEPAPLPVARAVKVPASLGAPVAGDPSAPAAPAAALDPRAIAEWERINLARAQLAEEEKRITALHAANDARAQWAQRYVEDPVSVIVEMIQEATGLTDDAAITDEVGDLITELSGKRLGLALAPDVRSRLDSRRAIKVVKAHQAKLTKQEQDLARKTEDARKAEQERGIVNTLQEEIQTSAAQYPYLAAEETAGAIVWDVIKRHHQITGEELKWEDAAKRANDYLRKQTDAYIARRRHLLTEAPAQRPATPDPNPSAPQGDPSSIRRSRTLRNGSASAPTGAAPADQPGRFDNEAHRARSLGKFRQALKPTE